MRVRDPPKKEGTEVHFLRVQNVEVGIGEGSQGLDVVGTDNTYKWFYIGSRQGGCADSLVFLDRSSSSRTEEGGLVLRRRGVLSRVTEPKWWLGKEVAGEVVQWFGISQMKTVQRVLLKNET